MLYRKHKQRYEFIKKNKPNDPHEHTDAFAFTAQFDSKLSINPDWASSQKINNTIEMSFHGTVHVPFDNVSCDASGLFPESRNG